MFHLYDVPRHPGSQARIVQAKTDTQAQKSMHLITFNPDDPSFLLFSLTVYLSVKENFQNSAQTFPWDDSAAMHFPALSSG